MRVTSSTDHREVSRHGSRASTPRLVVHLLLSSGVAAELPSGDVPESRVPEPSGVARAAGVSTVGLPTPDPLVGGFEPWAPIGTEEWPIGIQESLRPARAGVVVGRPVGNAVVRHRVARRLRHLLAPRLSALPDGARLVVRARPGAGSVGSDVLGQDLDDALSRAGRSARTTRAPRSGRSGGATRPTRPTRPTTVARSPGRGGAPASASS